MATTADDARSRSAGISYQELIANDVVAPPAPLTWENPLDVPVTSVPVTRYTTQSFYDLEMRDLWPRVWQMACREEEIPNVGDYSVYEIGLYSIIVVRTQE
ncbi:MAG: hypothetical protein V3T18_03220, partial [Pseudomonadales bacterium]